MTRDCHDNAKMGNVTPHDVVIMTFVPAPVLMEIKSEIKCIKTVGAKFCQSALFRLNSIKYQNRL